MKWTTCVMIAGAAGLAFLLFISARLFIALVREDVIRSKLPGFEHYVGQMEAPDIFWSQPNRSPTVTRNRFLSQLLYQPKQCIHQPCPRKEKLIHSRVFIFHSMDMSLCPVSNCRFIDEVLSPINSTADAVVFDEKYMPSKEESQRRRANQLWIAHMVEAPTYHTLSVLRDLRIDYWYSYYPAAHLLRTNFIYVPYSKPKPAPPFEQTRTKLAVWMASNCVPWSARNDYVKLLRQYVDVSLSTKHHTNIPVQVDIFGKCGDKKCKTDEECAKTIAANYKFYLAFENSHCDYYITEKLVINALNIGVVPIVMGAKRSQYEAFAPPNSFLHVDDFSGPAELAERMYQLDKNDTAYRELLHWRTLGRMVEDRFQRCQLCLLLWAHENHMPGLSQLERGEFHKVWNEERSFCQIAHYNETQLSNIHSVVVS